ncbi:15016_t:CDS:1, partial [Cetraspora pellucida]
SPSPIHSLGQLPSAILLYITNYHSLYYQLNCSFASLLAFHPKNQSPTHLQQKPGVNVNNLKDALTELLSWSWYSYQKGWDALG